MPRLRARQRAVGGDGQESEADTPWKITYLLHDFPPSFRSPGLRLDEFPSQA